MTWSTYPSGTRSLWRRRRQVRGHPQLEELAGTLGCDLERFDKVSGACTLSETSEREGCNIPLGQHALFPPPSGRQPHLGHVVRPEAMDSVLVHREGEGSVALLLTHRRRGDPKAFCDLTPGQAKAG